MEPERNWWDNGLSTVETILICVLVVLAVFGVIYIMNN